MAARLITQEDVFAACEKLAAANENTSAAKVYAVLGKGSLSTIMKFINLWKESAAAPAPEQSTTAAAETILTPEETQLWHDIAVKTKAITQKRTEAMIDQIRTEAENAIQAEKQTTADTIEYAEQVNEQLEKALEESQQQQKTIAELEASLIESNRRIVALEAEKAVTTDRLEDLKQALEDFKALAGLVEKKTPAAKPKTAKVVKKPATA